MSEFSLDTNAEKISNPKTKRYFREVLSSYNNGNYRSCTVSLFTVVVCDIVFKLQELVDRYRDSKAEKIMAEIRAMQEKNPTSPEWEKTLLELVKSRTDFFSIADFVNVEILHQHRHLCAHPAISEEYSLYEPNKEMTRAHIRNMLEAVLTRPSMMSARVFNDFLVDLSNTKKQMSNDTDLRNYLEHKYYSRLASVTKNVFFKQLWKIVFKCDSADCVENRAVNFKALSFMSEKYEEELLRFFKDDSQLFSNLDNISYELLFKFLGSFPRFYECFDESTKIEIKTTANSDGNLNMLAWFLSENVFSHLKGVEGGLFIDEFNSKSVNYGYMQQFYSALLKEGQRHAANEFILNHFNGSNEFEVANTRFSKIIRPNIDNFDLDDFKKFLDVVNSNYQIYARREARATNKQVVNKMSSKIPTDFDYSEYENVKH